MTGTVTRRFLKSESARSRRIVLGLSWCLFGFAAAVLVRSESKHLYLAVEVEPTRETAYSQQVVESTAMYSNIAWLLLAVGLGIIILTHKRMHRLGFLSVICPLVILGIAIASLLLTRLSDTRVAQLMRPFESQLISLDSLNPPQGWHMVGRDEKAVEYPEAARFWDVPGSLEQACHDLSVAVAEWVDAGTAEPKPPPLPGLSCIFHATKGTDNVVATATIAKPGAPVRVGIRLVSTRRVTPESLL